MSQNTLPNICTEALSATQLLHRQLQFNADRLQQRDRSLQQAVVFLAVMATLLAVLPCLAQNSMSLEVLTRACQVGFVAVGLTLTFAVGLILRSQNQDWLTLAAGAAGTERTIYLYRTLLQSTPDRGIWLSQQITKIQQQVQERLGESWLMLLTLPELGEPSESKDTIADLQAADYLQERLVFAQAAATQQVAALSTLRQRYQLILMICAVLVVLLPVLNSTWLGWGAICSSLGLALLLWLRSIALNHWLEMHSQVAIGLTLLRDYWWGLPAAEQTKQAFCRLVLATETILELPYRTIADQVRTVIATLQVAEPDLIQSIFDQPALFANESEQLETGSIDAVKLLPEVQAPATTPPAENVTNGKTIAEPTPVPKALLSPPPAVQQGRPHAFVVMPFGRKQAADGHWIDFNSIYQDLIKPALEQSGFEPFRADEEGSSGDILTDMFQELLLADLVIADLSIDNANVFYELGIRHALRRRGVVHIQAGRAYMPFDIFNVRTLPYHCNDQGHPDAEFLDKDRQALVKMIQATWVSERNRVHSPVFNLLAGLPEPERKSLRTPLAIGYWQEYTTLQARITIAQRQKQIGDVVLLAEEVSNPLIREDILAEAGKALKSMGNSALALKQYRQGLKLNSENLAFRCEEAYHLSRLGQSDEAIVKLEQVLQDAPGCVDATTYLARIYKDLWKNNWITIADEAERIRVAYEASFLLQKSLENYLRGYRLDQNQYYPGINALTLTALLDHLAMVAEVESGDADEAAYRSRLSALKGSVQFCLESGLQKSPNDHWAALSLGDLAVCTAESPQQVATAYRKALAIFWNNKFGLQATLDQLTLMKLLGFRPDHVQVGIAVLQAEIDRFEQQEKLFAPAKEEEVAKPAQIFLFTGHMIDRADRAKPRFPAEIESEAARRLEDTFNRLEAHSNCIAIAPGIACGGDILFIEACLKRGMRVEVYLPFEPSEFIQDSVAFAGDRWVERFYTILNSPNIKLHLQPDRLGPVPTGHDPYGRNNRWALYSTLMHDVKRVRLIALWDGQGGDGPGGTADMVQQVRQLGGMVEHIDITKFDYWLGHCPLKVSDSKV